MVSFNCEPKVGPKNSCSSLSSANIYLLILKQKIKNKNKCGERGSNTRPSDVDNQMEDVDNQMEAHCKRFCISYKCRKWKFECRDYEELNAYAS